MNKDFDCIKESRKWKAKTQREIRGMSRQERDAYLKEGVSSLYKSVKSKKAVRRTRKKTTA